MKSLDKAKNLDKTIIVLKLPILPQTKVSSIYPIPTFLQRGGFVKRNIFIYKQILAKFIIMNIKKIIIPLLINFLFTIGYPKDIISFDTALAIAKETNKPVLIDIFADW